MYVPAGAVPAAALARDGPVPAAHHDHHVAVHVALPAGDRPARITLLAALVIGSCVTSTDPILSQPIAKGPFADKFVARPLREIISSEAGANDGFGFPFLMLATFLIRHADVPGAGVGAKAAAGSAALHERATAAVSQGLLPPSLLARSSEEVGRLGGGVGSRAQELGRRDVASAKQQQQH
ncbi:hypothetical protein VTG60DRAFT_6884 [Thermothelomyces hinnuleus]